MNQRILITISVLVLIIPIALSASSSVSASCKPPCVTTTVTKSTTITQFATTTVISTTTAISDSTITETHQGPTSTTTLLEPTTVTSISTATTTVFSSNGLYETFTANPISEPTGVQQWNGQFFLEIEWHSSDYSVFGTVCQSSIPAQGDTSPVSCSGYVPFGASVKPYEIVIDNGPGVWSYSGCSWTPTTSGNTYSCDMYLTWINSFTFNAQNPTTWDGSYSPIVSGIIAAGSLYQCQANIQAGNSSVPCGPSYSFVQVNNGTSITVPSSVGLWNINGPTSYLITSGGNTYPLEYDLG